jgi:hypothetical protein
MSCWQRKRDTKLFQMSWIKHLPSWQATEPSLPPLTMLIQELPHHLTHLSQLPDDLSWIRLSLLPDFYTTLAALSTFLIAYYKLFFCPFGVPCL